MPRRHDIDTVFIIGAGPIVIGQGCEFDYSGVQACKALKKEGYRIVLVNSNPATVMTDTDMADRTYVEPITVDVVEEILRKERKEFPHERIALLPTMGGQTALNTALQLEKKGTLHELEIELIGAQSASIEKAEDRALFRTAMDKIGLESPYSYLVTNMTEAMEASEKIGFPLILRPSFTLGGSGGGIAYNRDDYQRMIAEGLQESPVGSVLVEESLVGWKEFEMEVIRDRKDNGIIVCSIENLDPMGVHTGDSITVAPALTLTDKEYQKMRESSLAVLREIGVETGGANVQFAINPQTGRMVVIEMNPRVSRSSALASKATGFPIAAVAAKLAIGYTLDEIRNDITEVTPASFEPTLDYIVVKIPRFSFEKFRGVDDTLATAMHAIGEVMSMGRTFQEALQKALCSLEKGYDGLTPLPYRKEGGEYDGTREGLLASIKRPHPKRILKIAEGFRQGLSVEEIHQACHVDPWFLRQIESLVLWEEKIPHLFDSEGNVSDSDGLFTTKEMGFSDACLARLTGFSEDHIRQARMNVNVVPTYHCVDTCSSEFPGKTAYSYSCYERFPVSQTVERKESAPSSREKVVILGSGPNRIGQGIEFDYCCVHASRALHDMGYETIMVNCNPETVSTDYDTSDRLYFEPIILENVLDLIQYEEQGGPVKGVIVQFGGQTPLKLAEDLGRYGIPILGTPYDVIDLAEDRERFKELVDRLDLKQPPSGIAHKMEDALDVAERIGYPLVVRPSYVLGGQMMEIIHHRHTLEAYMKKHQGRINTLLIDHYLVGAIEVDVDAICDGEDVYISGIMEHIEEAGVHSGDSSCSLPPHSLSHEIIMRLKDQTTKIAKAMNVKGLMNVQYAIKGDDIYILEVNPRASRTVPFVVKATGVPVPQIAVHIMMGKKLRDFSLPDILNLDHVAVKTPIFPFKKFSGSDVVLGPEMRSTGESMGIDRHFEQAFVKAQKGVGTHLPTSGTVFVSVKDDDKEALTETIRKLQQNGFTIMATSGTASFLTSKGIDVETVHKVQQGRPHIVDKLIDGKIDLIFNTTEGEKAIRDSFSIRQTAVLNSIPYFTTLSACKAAGMALISGQGRPFHFLSLQEYFK